MRMQRELASLEGVELNLLSQMRDLKEKIGLADKSAAERNRRIAWLEAEMIPEAEQNVALAQEAVDSPLNFWCRITNRLIGKDKSLLLNRDHSEVARLFDTLEYDDQRFKFEPVPGMEDHFQISPRHNPDDALARCVSDAKRIIAQVGQGQ